VENLFRAFIKKNKQTNKPLRQTGAERLGEGRRWRRRSVAAVRAAPGAGPLQTPHRFPLLLLLSFVAYCWWRLWTLWCLLLDEKVEKAKFSLFL
jgi:hypothetical protein